MSNNMNQDDREFNGAFDQWLRKNKPYAPVQIKDMDKFLEGVNKKMHDEKTAWPNRLKKGLVRGSAVMCVVLLSFGIFSFQDVGSDGFGLIELANPKVVERMVVDEFSGNGFNVYHEDSGEKIQEFNHQMAAGEGVLAGAKGWHFRGKTFWLMEREYSALGETRIYATASLKPKSRHSRELYALFMEWEAIQVQIDSGKIQSTGKQITRQLDGVMFSISSWVVERPEGQVIYFKGTPIR